ncbi:hypothetical protein HEP81_01547 [Streptomyces griseofuscus]|uniref:Uncharacterized protein n=1 Tax=Streptomyces griseofuscus TaxID=146922 RepID=A0A7H1PUZ6_9ACTN|nr:hypothetical protein HEP81_01547 [Streptomyces griseofuscus]
MSATKMSRAFSPFVRHHINMHGRHSFQPPHLPGGLRPLRDPCSGSGE